VVRRCVGSRNFKNDEAMAALGRSTSKKSFIIILTIYLELMFYVLQIIQNFVTGAFLAAQLWKTPFKLIINIQFHLQVT